MKTLTRLTISIIIIFVFLSTALADEIHLKNGRVVNASVYSEEDGMITYGRDEWTVGISKKLVEKIVYIAEAWKAKAANVNASGSVAKDPWRPQLIFEQKRRMMSDFNMGIFRESDRLLWKCGIP